MTPGRPLDEELHIGSDVATGAVAFGRMAIDLTDLPELLRISLRK